MLPEYSATSSFLLIYSKGSLGECESNLGFSFAQTLIYTYLIGIELSLRSCISVTFDKNSKVTGRWEGSDKPLETKIERRDFLFH